MRTDTSTESFLTAGHPPIDDCWNRIGVQGDRSCPELAAYGHCRHCPVHTVAAGVLLRHMPQREGIEERTRALSQPEPTVEVGTEAAVIFRVGTEWLALPTSAVTAVALPRRPRSIPHRRSPVVLGVINLRGELVVCVSLAIALGASERPPDVSAEANQQTRLLVIQRGDLRLACPVDHVHGVVSFHPRSLREVPSTLARASTSCTRKLLPWQERSVGLLDDVRLFALLTERLS